MNILLIILLIAPSILSAQQNSQKENVTLLEANVFKANTADLAGTYQPVNIEYGYPSLASFSYINEQAENAFSHINFEFVPVEYCQFVRICITKAISYTKLLKHTISEDQCNDYITYNPVTGAIEIKYGAINTKGYTSSLNMTGTQEGRRLYYWTKIFYTENSFKDNTFKHEDLDFKDKMFLVFTNNRQCHPIIMIDGTISNMEIYGEKSVKNTTKLPSEFEYLQLGTLNSTLYTVNEVKGVGRSVDYFPVLKKLTLAKDHLKNIKFKCKLAGGGRNKNVIVETSVIEAVKKTNTKGGFEAKVLIELEDCHWMRIWFTKATAQWSEYPTAFAPKHSIDFLLSEGLVFLPERENAVRIPISVDEISHITLKYHPKNQIIEILFGHSNGYQYPITFKSDIMKDDTFKMFMIRSPKCDAVFGSNSRGVIAHGKKTQLNKFLLDNCKAYSIEKAA